MPKIIKGLVEHSIRALRPKAPTSTWVGPDFKSCSYADAKKGAILYTDGIQYCIAVLLRPKDIKDNSYFSFAHIETIVKKDMVSERVSKMIKGCSSLNGVDPEELSATLYSRYLSGSTFPVLSAYVESGNDRVKGSLNKGGVIDIDMQTGGSHLITTDGYDVSEVGPFSEMTNKIKGAAYDKLIDLKDATRNYQYVKDFSISKYDDKKIFYSDNLRYCTAILIKPKNIKDGDNYAFLHLETVSFIEKSEALVESVVNELKQLNNCNSEDMEYKSYSRSWSSFSFAQMTADNLNHVRNIMGARGVHYANHEIGHSEYVVTDGKEIESGLPMKTLLSLRANGEMGSKSSKDEGR